MVHNLAPQAIDCRTIDNLWLYTWFQYSAVCYLKGGAAQSRKGGAVARYWAWSSRIIEHT